MINSMAAWKRHIRIFALDACVIAGAWFLAYYLRYNFSMPDSLISNLCLTFPIVVITQTFVNFYMGLHRGAWQYTSVKDLKKIVQSSLMGTILSTLLLFFIFRMQDVPRSVPVIYVTLLIMFLGTLRILPRYFYESFAYSKQDGVRVVIVGAGQAAESLVRDLLRSKDMKYVPVAFFDDDRHKFKSEIHGVPVIGRIEKMAEYVKIHNVQMIFIAIPSASAIVMQRIVRLCEQTNLPFRTLPSVKDLVDGKVMINALREVSLEDLLGRDPIVIDWLKITNSVVNKVVLVTGGGGSIGSELCRQIIQLKPRMLVIADNNEFNLYSIEMELRENFPEMLFHFLLVDVSDKQGVHEMMQRFLPQVVFHAAAYKHVPILESQIRAAVKNNVVGTVILAEAAAQIQVQQFILISTDKAVNPTNIMGATKRMAEIFCQNFSAHTETQFITVRFGNVLGSAGSVVPLFKKQLEKGGPLTVTHPDVTRYFMTIPEASQLILQATTLGAGGEVFVLDMGEPVKIQYLAEQIIQLAGLQVNQDIQIVYTGLRPGEKLYEELFHEREHLLPTTHHKIFQARARQVDFQMMQDFILALVQACDSFDEDNLRDLLKKLVPEYHSGASVPSTLVLENSSC